MLGGQTDWGGAWFTRPYDSYGPVTNDYMSDPWGPLPVETRVTAPPILE